MSSTDTGQARVSTFNTTRQSHIFLSFSLLTLILLYRIGLDSGCVYGRRLSAFVLGSPTSLSPLSKPSHFDLSAFRVFTNTTSPPSLDLLNSYFNKPSPSPTKTTAKVEEKVKRPVLGTLSQLWTLLEPTKRVKRDVIDSDSITLTSISKSSTAIVSEMTPSQVKEVEEMVVTQVSAPNVRAELEPAEEEEELEFSEEGVVLDGRKAWVVSRSCRDTGGS